MAVIDDEEKTWKDVYLDMQEFRSGIYFTDKRTKGACYYLDKFQCAVEGCQNKEYFSNQGQYEEHLEKEHYKYLCKLCVKKSTLLLNE